MSRSMKIIYRRRNSDSQGNFGEKNDTLEGNDLTCKRCFQEVSEVANRLGMSAYNFFFIPVVEIKKVQILLEK